MRILNEYRGEYISKWENSDFNIYVITGMIQGGNPVAGKVVQIRLEAGQFGSDMVFLRDDKGNLATHENQAFWKVPEKYHKYLDSQFTEEQDSINTEYTTMGDLPETGFIISSKIKDGETTPMRNIKQALCNKIGELINE